MRSDAKLGLAMSILVTGFAIAFCFPRQDFRRHDISMEVANIDESQYELRPIGEQLALRDRGESEDRNDDVQTVDEFRAALISPIRVGETTQLPALDETVGLSALLNLSTETDSDPELQFSQPGKESPEKALTYVVQSGDTLSGIAHRTLGRSSRFLDIYEANRDVLNSPDDLRPGLTLKIPGSIADVLTTTDESSAAANSADGPQQSQPRIAISQAPAPLPVNEITGSSTLPQNLYVVRPGDTLERIAQRFYGSVNSVERIMRANPTINLLKLRPGAMLVLPDVHVQE